jgi:hypothetical protein
MFKNIAFVSSLIKFVTLYAALSEPGVIFNTLLKIREKY